MPSLIVALLVDSNGLTVEYLLMTAPHSLGLGNVSAFSAKMTTAAVTSCPHSFLVRTPQTTISASVYVQQAMLLLMHASLVEAIVD